MKFITATKYLLEILDLILQCLDIKKQKFINKTLKKGVVVSFYDVSVGGYLLSSYFSFYSDQ